MNLADIALIHKTATIPDAGTKTEAIELEYSTTAVGIYHPIINTSTAFTFEASADGVTFVPVENGSGAAYSITINNAAAGYLPIKELTVFAGIRFLKIVVANAQTGAKVLTLAVRPIL